MQLFLKSTGRRQEVFYSLATFLKFYTSDFSRQKYFIVVNLSYDFILTRRWHPQGKHKKRKWNLLQKAILSPTSFFVKVCTDCEKIYKERTRLYLEGKLGLALRLSPNNHSEN